MMPTNLKHLIVDNLRPATLARFTLPINALFIILVAYSLAQLSWNLYPAKHPTASPDGEQPNAVPSQLATAENKRTDYSLIASWHLFGQASEVKVAPQAPVLAPETRLNLKLVGIYFSKDGNKTLALIAEGGGEELSYGIGEQLPQSKARLEQIFRDRVVLSRSGRLESLSLPSEGEGGDSTPLLNLQQSPVPGEDEEPVIEESPGGSEEAPDDAAAEPEPIDVSAIASRFRNKIAQPQDLQELALASPYVQNGQFMGFRLRPGRDRELLAQLGLRAGDVITAINGTRIDDPTKGLGLLQQLGNADQISIQVLRNGTEIPFTYVLTSQ